MEGQQYVNVILLNSSNIYV